MKKILAPIRHRDAYTRAVEKILLDYFDEVIFGPIVDACEDENVHVRENATGTAVAQALRSGRIWYADGEFSGSFNAEISSELRAMGAKFNSGKGTFALTALPIEVASAAALSVLKSKELHKTIDTRLATMQENVSLANLGLEMDATVSRIVQDLVHQFNSSISGTDLIGVSADLTPAIAKAMTEQLTESLNYEIKDFVQSEIPALRREVQANAFAGYRTDQLAAIIEARYGVTKRKAAFLADQETGLAISKFREQRYREVGSRTYRWSTSHDERVRVDHRLLDGNVFDWDSPPVTCRATGDRNHPGEDFRCRCVALPILEIPE